MQIEAEEDRKDTPPAELKDCWANGRSLRKSFLYKSDALVAKHSLQITSVRERIFEQIKSSMGH